MQTQDTLYLKIPQNIVVEKRKVTLGDIASMECSDGVLLPRLKTLPVYSFPESKQKYKHERQVISVLSVIKKIHASFPNLQIDNIGETDFVLVYEAAKEPLSLSWFKTAILCVVLFFGSAFSIMAFNNDIGINEMFGSLTRQVTGSTEKGHVLLQTTYSIGLSVGILVFYNHLGRKKNKKDPTPIQVEMRKYETEADTAFIENSSRSGNSIEEN